MRQPRRGKDTRGSGKTLNGLGVGETLMRERHVFVREGETFMRRGTHEEGETLMRAGETFVREGDTREKERHK